MSTEEEDPFAPPEDLEVSLDLGTGFVQGSKDPATLAQHQDFIRSSQKQMDFSTSKETGGRRSNASPKSRGAGESYAEKNYDDRKLYWVLTRVPVLVILGWFTISHLAVDGQWVFIDGVNLLFHEAGHVVFRWAGDTMWFLGGSLLQLLLPAAATVYFFSVRHERFAAAACLWWVGENFLNIARYMHDAPVEELPLVGGNIHDWKYLFTKWDLYRQARDIAEVVRVLGIILMVGTLAYMLYMTVRPTDKQLAAGLEY